MKALSLGIYFIVVTALTVFFRSSVLAGADYKIHSLELLFIGAFIGVVFLLPAKLKPIYLFFISTILSLFYVAATWYEAYFQTVPSYFDLRQSGQVGSVLEIVPLLHSFSDYFYVLLPLSVVVLWKWIKEWGFVKKRWILVAYLVLIPLLTWEVLQLERKAPIYNVSVTSKEAGYVRTQAALFLQRAKQNDGDAIQHFDYKSIIEKKGNVYMPVTQHENYGIAKDRHLFIIQVESLQELAVDLEIDGQPVMPNTQELLSESIRFTNMYQQIGAGNTSDSEWLLHTSLYPTGEEPVVNSLNGNLVPSFNTTLKENGYWTTTYHADKITYWKRDLLYPALQFDKAYATPEIPEEDVIGFGPSDRVLFDFVEKTIDEELAMNKKIYANIMTLTSHTPFTMPKEEELLDLPEELEGTYVGDYMQSVRYTDEEIGRFIDYLKDRGIYEQSTIVIFGDHSGLHGRPMTPQNNELMKELIGHTYTLNDRFNLPFIITIPGAVTQAEEVDHLAGQIDMMPTIMSFMGIEPNYPVFGHNAYHYDKNVLGMRYYMPTGSFIENTYFYIEESTRFPARMYEREGYRKINVREDVAEQYQQVVLEMMQLSDQYIRLHLNQEE
ncbi:LTA synthase family protein [Chryseomicrobium palamuruense]